MYEELVGALRKRAMDLPEKFSRNAVNIDLLMKAADAIEELSKPRWIPVTERLPEQCEDVQILFPNNQAAGFYSRNDEWCIYTGADWFSIIGEDEVKPTHWAKKLPEPPKEET